MASKAAKQQPADHDEQFAEYLATARKEAEAWLDAKAQEMAKAYSNIPVSWHRQSLMARASQIGCPCMAVIMQVEGKK